MRSRTKVALGALAILLAAVAVGAAALRSVDVRAIGRTDPRRAASYQLPSFNFSETYTDGEVLGIAIGSTRAEAIEAAECAGFTVSPSGWGDNRAGGAALYSRPDLRRVMSRQQHLNYHDVSDSKRGLIISFRGDRVSSIKVYYINSEAV